jgi:HlyD family secretion protein
MKRFLIILVVAIVLAAGAGLYWKKQQALGSEGQYQIGTVTRGDVQQEIVATGTVEPQEVVDVGAQVSGLITALGQDPHDPTKSVDYGTTIEKNGVLATIDTTIYQSDVENGEAELASAQANVEVAKANVVLDQAKLTEAQNDWNRAQKLGAGEALSQSEYDGYEATYLTAKATMDLAAATVAQAEANVKDNQANLDRDKQNLTYCTIISPVKGVVIDRRVSVGETVASSLNAPSLFLIAEDLTKMQLWISVNEADIGKIHAGMLVTFNVDAYPDRTFKGIVNKVRLNATMSQNVVTYVVEVNADNPDNALLPYLTANAKFIVAEQDDALLVPNSALRWHPRNNEQADAALAASDAAAAQATPTPATDAGSAPDGAAAGAGRRGGRSGGAAKAKVKQQYIWVQSGTELHPIPVEVGITDGVVSAITGDLKEGDEIITGNAQTAVAADTTTNPFAPVLARGGRGGGGAAGGGGAGGGGGRAGGGGGGGGG